MQDLGGYFGWERFPAGDGVPLPDAPLFASGRQALAHWLAARGARRLHVPGWICPAVLDAAAAAGAAPVFHALGPDLRPVAWPEPGPDDVLLVLNPCGLHPEDPRPAGWDPARVIVDDTMACLRGPRAACASFDSWRKVLPVPDGAALHADGVPVPDRPPLPGDDAYLRLRAEGGAQAGRAAFRAHEDAVAGWPAAGPSRVTLDVLARLDGEAVRRRRRTNYAALAAALEDANTLALPPLAPDAVPLAYPFLPAGGDRHEALWARRVWVPRLWGDDPRLATGDAGRRLATDLLPLPVDHRYGADDMARLAGLVRELAA